jgi:hypothetical protein
MKHRERLHPLALVPMIVAAMAVGWFSFWLWGRGQEHEHAFRTVKCQANMREIGEHLTRYAKDNGGKLPATLGGLGIPDPSNHQCPAIPEARRAAGLDQSYEYVANDGVFLDARQVWLFEASDRHGRSDIHVLFSDGMVQAISHHDAVRLGTGRLQQYAKNVGGGR